MCRLGRREELVDERRARQRQCEAIRGFQGEAQVLLLQRHLESRREVPRDHARLEVRELPRARGALRDRRQHHCGVHARPRAEQQRLGHRQVVQDDGDLVAQLHGLASAELPAVRDRAPHRLEGRACPLDRLGGSAHHDRDGAADCALLSAGHRCIEERCFVFREHRHDRSRDLRGDRRHVDDHRSGMRALDDASATEDHRLHIGARGDARDHDVAPRRHIRRRGVTLRQPSRGGPASDSTPRPRNPPAAGLAPSVRT